MSLKKTICLVVGGLLSVSIFAGCEGKPQEISFTPTSVEGSLSFIDYTRQGDGNGCATGYYRLIPRDNGSNNICFIDYKERSQIFLCNRPECQHNDDTCTSWFPYGAGGGALFATNDHLFYMSFGNRKPDIASFLGEDALPSLVQMDLNGANHEVLYKFSASDIIREGIVYSQTAIYFLCDSFENFEQNGHVPERSLYQYSLDTKSLSKLKSLDVTTQIIGVNNREIIFSISEGAQDFSISRDSLQSTVQSYNVDTCAEYTLLSHPYTSIGRIDDGYYYLYDPLTTALSKIKLAPNASSEIVKKMVFEEEFQSYPCDIKTIFDHHLFIRYEIPKDEERIDYSTSLYAIDLTSGKAQLIKMRTQASGGLRAPKEVEIVDELENQFLVISFVEFIDVSIPISKSPPKLSYAYFHYSLIDKQDYYDSNPDYIPIEAG